jgi:hypothetical protein
MMRGSTDEVAAVIIDTRTMIIAGFMAYTFPFGVPSPNSQTMYLGRVPSLFEVGYSVGWTAISRNEIEKREIWGDV